VRAFFFLGVLAVALSSFGYRQHVREARRHVMLQVKGVNDEMGIHVNCNDYRLISSGGTTIDLGWRQPDDRISISLLNSFGRDAALRVIGFSNEREIFDLHPHRAVTNASGFRVPTDHIGFAVTYTANGVFLGEAGCNDPESVAYSIVPHYHLLPDATPNGRRRSHPILQGAGEVAPFDEFIDGLGTKPLWIAAILGFVAAGTTPSTQAFARRNLSLEILISLIGIGLGVIQFGLVFLWLAILGLGLACLLISAVALLRQHSS
jgi:hypothetical protein